MRANTKKPTTTATTNLLYYEQNMKRYVFNILKQLNKTKQNKNIKINCVALVF